MVFCAVWSLEYRLVEKGGATSAAAPLKALDVRSMWKKKQTQNKKKKNSEIVFPVLPPFTKGMILWVDSLPFLHFRDILFLKKYAE